MNNDVNTAAGRVGVSTRVIIWLAGGQDVRINVTAAGTFEARLTLTWEVAQVCFTAADQVSRMAAEVRESHGVGAVLPEVIGPRLIHGTAEDLGPLPVAVVTFDEPRRSRPSPGAPGGPGGWTCTRGICTCGSPTAVVCSASPTP